MTIDLNPENEQPRCPHCLRTYTVVVVAVNGAGEPICRCTGHKCTNRAWTEKRRVQPSRLDVAPADAWGGEAAE